MPTSNRAYLMVYYADTDGDGAVETTPRYSSRVCIPREIKPIDGRKRRVNVHPTLDGGVMVLAHGRAGVTDQRAPGAFVLTWEHVPDTFRHLVEADYAAGRLVSLRLDHRWRQLEVFSSGLADRTVTVLAGYVMSGGDTYWLAADTEIICAADHIVVYAVLADGIVTVDSGIDGSGEESGDLVPVGAMTLAEISITDDLVTVISDPSGVDNRRTGEITDLDILPAPGGGVGMTLTLQEVW